MGRFMNTNFLWKFDKVFLCFPKQKKLQKCQKKLINLFFLFPIHLFFFFQGCFHFHFKFLKKKKDFIFELKYFRRWTWIILICLCFVLYFIYVGGHCYKILMSKRIIFGLSMQGKDINIFVTFRIWLIKGFQRFKSENTKYFFSDIPY